MPLGQIRGEYLRPARDFDGTLVISGQCAHDMIHPFQTEQNIVADRIVEVKCGIRIQQLSKDNVRQAVRLLLNDHRYEENREIFPQSLKAAGGYLKAAEYILTHIRLLSGANR